MSDSVRDIESAETALEASKLYDGFQQVTVHDLLGAPVAETLTESFVPRIASLAKRGITPKLAMIRVGAQEGDLSYERSACKRCDAVGLVVEKLVLPQDCTQEQLLNTIQYVNANPDIHGCLMFRPLPRNLNEKAACAALLPTKDVDGITLGSLYGVFSNQSVGYPPCTAEAVIKLLEHYEIELAGKRVVVIGRSLVIGRPVAMMLLAANATVTICHSQTKNLASVCKEADILVVAAGQAEMVKAQYTRPGQVVIDVGINWDAAAGKLVGDVAFEDVAPIVGAITPVPRGVGAVTTAVLIGHTIAAAESCN